MQRVVITGIGALTPIGNGISSFLDGLQNGKSGAARIQQFDPTNFKTQFACEVKDLKIEDHLDRREAKRMDLFAQISMIAAAEAINDSGIDFDKVDRSRAGVILGSGIGGLRTVESEVENFVLGDGTPRYSPFMIPKMISDIAPGHISIKYGLEGINYTTVSACASSSHALINSADYIRLGKADVLISGGSEAVVLKPGIGAFNSMKALSTRNDDPKTASRPFDADRDGFVLGEGAGILVLESLEHALKRGAHIYAEITGSGMTADAYHLTAPHPEGKGASRAMSLALQEAKLDTSDIDYINVHGTSTPLGDVAELKAIQNVFGTDVYDLNISSTKSMTGHLLGAAGAIEGIASVLSIEHQFVPPTINQFNLDPQIDPKLNLTPNKLQERVVRHCLSNTFGFGGHNATLIFSQYTG